jgi:hypothetical protein
MINSQSAAALRVSAPVVAIAKSLAYERSEICPVKVVLAV